DDVAEMLGETIDERHDFITTRYGQRAVGTEVVLYVDHDKGIVVADGVSHGQICLLVFLSRRRRYAAANSVAARAGVNVCGELDQVVADLHRIYDSRREPPQLFRQAFELTFGL